MRPGSNPDYIYIYIYIYKGVHIKTAELDALSVDAEMDAEDIIWTLEGYEVDAETDSERIFTGMHI